MSDVSAPVILSNFDRLARSLRCAMLHGIVACDCGRDIVSTEEGGVNSAGTVSNLDRVGEPVREGNRCDGCGAAETTLADSSLKGVSKRVFKRLQLHPVPAARRQHSLAQKNPLVSCGPLCDAHGYCATFADQDWDEATLRLNRQRLFHVIDVSCVTYVSSSTAAHRAAHCKWSTSVIGPASPRVCNVHAPVSMAVRRRAP